MDKDIGKTLGVLLPIAVIFVFVMSLFFWNKKDPTNQDMETLMRDYPRGYRG